MNLSLRSRLGLALAAVVLLSVVAQAAMMVVEENESTELIRGERYDLGSALHVAESEVDVVASDEDARGTASDPVELSADEPPANTVMEQDHWQYTVLLEEQTASSLASGEFRVDLYVSGEGMDNEHAGSVYVGQASSSSSQVEGAWISWDLGSQLPDNPLFVVKAHPHTDAGETVEVTLESDYDAVEGYVWKGVGGDIDGQTNPEITVEPGATVTFTIRHGCGEGDTAPHNFALRDDSGSKVAASDDVTDCGEEDQVTWTAPSSEAQFGYRCDYHPDSMNGNLQVSSSGEASGSILPDGPASRPAGTGPGS